LLIGGGLTISTGLLAILAASGDRPGSLLAIGIVASVALVMIGPYSMLAGSISLDMGGKEGGATASGWIDGVGYLGGIISGWTIGKLAEQSGWGSAFGLLAVTAAISAGVAAYWYSGSSRNT
jgi:OPA family glycerol-3-phosphate transporter-like MFS transporter